MKKSLFSRFTGAGSGESLSDIWSYFWPECIATIVLYALPAFLDSWWITQACSAKEFGIFGVTNTLFQLVFKMGDAVSTGIMISCGRYNGAGDYKSVGKSFTTALWLSILMGAFVAGLMYLGAEMIYSFYNTPTSEIGSYIPFLRFRAISVFFMFCHFPFTGFLRGIKNTKIPMVLSVTGTFLFVIMDYILIFGHCGYTAYGMEGSAIAAVVQHLFMAVGAIAYILFSNIRSLYPLRLIRDFTPTLIQESVSLTWPVIVDKSALAFAGMWLAATLSSLGTTAKASYAAIHMFQRIFILPSVACTTVITFLVSNRMGSKDWIGIKNTTKKAIIFSSFFVITPLMIISSYPTFFIGLFDRTGSYTDLAAQALPLISAFVIFDILQVLLSGALRGAREVKTVMYGRVVPLILFFAPVSYLIAQLPFGSLFFKFVLIYISFYISNAFMTIYYAIKLYAKGSYTNTKDSLYGTH